MFPRKKINIMCEFLVSETEQNGNNSLAVPFLPSNPSCVKATVRNKMVSNYREAGTKTHACTVQSPKI